MSDLSPEEENRRLEEIQRADREADRERTEREIARLRAKEEAGELGPMIPRPGLPGAPESIEAISGRVLEIVRRQERERLGLPCYRAMYPDGAVPQTESARADDLVGKAACEVAGAFAACELRGKALCPRARAIEMREQVADRLAKARVPALERSFVLAAYDAGKGALLPLDSLTTVRAFAQRRRQTVAIQNGAEVAREIAGGGWKFEERRGRVSLSGDERILVLGGNMGRGKTVAAEMFLGRSGGLYLTEPQISRPARGNDADLVAEAKAAKVLVLDQVGRANRGPSDFGPAVVEEIVDARAAAGTVTILAGNFTLDDFLGRYTPVTQDRVWGFGAFVLFGGESLRAGAKR